MIIDEVSYRAGVYRGESTAWLRAAQNVRAILNLHKMEDVLRSDLEALMDKFGQYGLGAANIADRLRPENIGS